MQAYRGALGDANTSFVLSPDSEFFRYFAHPSENMPIREANSDAPSAEGRAEAAPGAPSTATGPRASAVD
jgi:membrane protease subunit HflC